MEAAPDVPVPDRFRGKTFYECLGLEREATASEIRTAYRKQALRFHPDHNKQESARADFQYLSLVYQTLSDEKKRAYYDRTGEVLETSQEFEDAYKAWRLIFPEITTEDIERFRETYIGSPAEEEDIVEAFNLAEGDMNIVMTAVPYADADSADRISGVVERLLKEKRLVAEPAVKRRFTRTRKGLAKRVRAEALDEAAEAEELARELKLPETRGGGDAALQALIQARHRDRQAAGSAFLDQLAEKYSNAEKKQKQQKQNKSKKTVSGGKRKAASQDDDDEDENDDDDEMDDRKEDDSDSESEEERRPANRKQGGQSKRVKRE